MPRYIEELVARQVERSELARKSGVSTGVPCSNLTVTISRRMGSGARVVAQKVAHDLGWSLWSKELINAIAEDADVSQKVVEVFDEKTISEIEMFARSILGDYEMGNFIYPIHLAKAVAAIAKLGNAVILGRGSWLLLPDALSIRIDASDEHRIANMVRYENMTPHDAEVKIHESDRDRRHFLERTFSREKIERFHFDLEIWMDKFSPDEAAEIVKTAIAVRCKQLMGKAES